MKFFFICFTSMSVHFGSGVCKWRRKFGAFAFGGLRLKVLMRATHHENLFIHSLRYATFHLTMCSVTLSCQASHEVRFKVYHYW